MREHLRRRVTQYRPATGASSASGGLSRRRRTPMRPDHRGTAAMVTRYGGVGASAAWFACGSMSRALALDGALLPDGNKRAALVDGIAFVALPSICTGGTRVSGSALVTQPPRVLFSSLLRAATHRTVWHPPVHAGRSRSVCWSLGKEALPASQYETTPWM